jgi:hypothetical protein
MARTGVLLILSLLLAPTNLRSQGLDFDFYRTRVEPIFLKMRAPTGPGGSCFICHSKVISRFRLEPVSPLTLSWSGEQSRLNFETASRLVTPGEPLGSRLLRHPLANNAGGDGRHAGGKQFGSQDDPEWQTLAAWVRTASAAAGVATPSTPTPDLDFEFFKTRVQSVFLRKREGLARCITCHSRSSAFRLQPLPEGRTTWNEEESRRNYQAVRRVVVPGDPLVSRLLMLPLAHEAGGAPFHPGGRHWASRDEEEWRMLASWVTGSQQ